MTQAFNVFLLALAALAPATMSANAETLTVEVKGLRSQTGQVLVALHDNSTSFPSDWSNAKRAVRISAVQKTPVAEFRNLKRGSYAVIVVHDEDSDGAMTKNIIGFPREGFGSSNNPSVFGPPRFRAARFELTKDRTLTIRVTYL